MAFDTVGGYLKDVRTLLQDKVQPYRYSTHSLVRALNLTLLEMRRVRPDLFVDYLDNVPQYFAAPDDDLLPDVPEEAMTSVLQEWLPLEQQFRQAVVHGVTGHAIMRDQEDIEDERSTGFMQTMVNILTDANITKGKQPPKN